MEDDRRQKWLTILFFSFSGIVFGISLYLVTAGSIGHAEAEGAATTAGATRPYTAEPTGEVVLERGQRMRLGGLDVIYRGSHGRKLRLDVFVLELDPQYAYRHAIALDKAGGGFRLGGMELKLLSARESHAKILWNRKS